MPDENASTNKVSARIVAIDALRGFDMFFLTGGVSLVAALLIYLFPESKEWVNYHSSHIAWGKGFSAWDLVMPLFIFIVGAAMPFSIGRRIHTEPKWKIYRKVITRFFVLFVLGMMVQGNLLSFKLKNIDFFCNTLQAIGGGYLISSILMMHLKIRWQAVAMFGMLIAYWLIMMYVPYPNKSGEWVHGMLEPYNNVAYFVDLYLQGDFQDGTEYTWIVSQLAFGGLTMLGVFAGYILQCSWSHWKKLGCLFLVGVLLLILGRAWSEIFPIIKQLFTSSMVLWAAGWCYLLLAAFYLLTDVLGFKKLVFPLVVIGSNALFVYIWVMLVNPLNSFSPKLFLGFSDLFGDAKQVIYYLCNYLFIWLVLCFLYKKKTFIKI